MEEEGVKVGGEKPRGARTADKAGWIKKSSGGLLGLWKDRYLLLCQAQLLVYENECSHLPTSGLCPFSSEHTWSLDHEGAEVVCWELTKPRVKTEEERWLLLVNDVRVPGWRLSEGPSAEDGLSLCAFDRWSAWGRTGPAAGRASCPLLISLSQRASGYLGKFMTVPGQEGWSIQISVTKGATLEKRFAFAA